ncbi:MAG: hypothetical protein Ct9H90mP3_0040 [Flammeovirgaceae bacterium]|nr:MAG: hypothetical protein Ct9H90mP3_0040 [Flammeovirgaceae bacterium]
MAYSHIAHDCIIDNNCVIVNGVQIAGHVKVNEYAIIGGGTLVHHLLNRRTFYVAGGSL